MAFVLTKADEQKLVGVNRHLVAVVRLVALRSPEPFRVIEGLRTYNRQKELFLERKTKTLKSKHLVGRAVDIAPIVRGSVSWEWPSFTPLVDLARQAAKDLNTEMVFGYDWGWDAPHWELKEP